MSWSNLHEFNALDPSKVSLRSPSLSLSLSVAAAALLSLSLCLCVSLFLRSHFSLCPHRSTFRSAPRLPHPTPTLCLKFLLIVSVHIENALVRNFRMTYPRLVGGGADAGGARLRRRLKTDNKSIVNTGSRTNLKHAGTKHCSEVSTFDRL